MLSVADWFWLWLSFVLPVFRRLSSTDSCGVSGFAVVSFAADRLVLQYCAEWVDNVVTCMPLNRILRLIVLAAGVAAVFAALVAVLPCFFVMSSRFQQLPFTETKFTGRLAAEQTSWFVTIYSRPLVLHVRTQLWQSTDGAATGAFDGAEALPNWTVVAEQTLLHQPDGKPSESVFVDDIGIGWPKPLLAYRVIWEGDKAKATFVPRIVYGAKISFLPGVGETPIWPTRVLWRGLLFNWFAMLPIATALVFIPLIVQSFRRSFRQEFQRCGNCGYSRLGDSTQWVCSECGSAQTLVAPAGWTSRFTVWSFFASPRAVVRLAFALSIALIAVIAGVYLARFIR
ncbi:MAG: hypothetical protein J0L78_03680 [Planctomycetes bacterium]|nr:hypothetical protein [Planctomycetota bacterium]